MDAPECCIPGVVDAETVAGLVSFAVQAVEGYVLAGEVGAVAYVDRGIAVNPGSRRRLHAYVAQIEVVDAPHAQ